MIPKNWANGNMRFVGPDNIVREHSTKAHLAWKLPHLCFYCIGTGEAAEGDRNSGYDCLRCLGTGRTPK